MWLCFLMCPASMRPRGTAPRLPALWVWSHTATTDTKMRLQAWGRGRCESNRKHATVVDVEEVQARWGSLFNSSKFLFLVFRSRDLQRYCFRHTAIQHQSFLQCQLASHPLLWQTHSSFSSAECVLRRGSTLHSCHWHNWSPALVDLLTSYSRLPPTSFLLPSLNTGLKAGLSIPLYLVISSPRTLYPPVKQDHAMFAFSSPWHLPVPTMLQQIVQTLLLLAVAKYSIVYVCHTFTIHASSLDR